VPHRGVIVGLGNIARQSHLPALLDDPSGSRRFDVVGTVDARPGIESLAGIPHFGSLEAALAAVGPDFVDICTPTASHLSLCRQALAAGCHVLCEKPVALTGDDIQELADLARGQRRVLMACHQYRFNPAWRGLRSWLDQGLIGRWHLAEFQVYRLAADGGATGTDQPWRGQRTHSGGGILLDHGTHLIYQLLDVAGPPRAIQSWSGNLRHRNYDVEDTAHLLLDFGDRLGTMFLTWAADRRDTRIRFFGEDGSIEWTGGLLTRRGRHGEEAIDYSAELDKRNYFRWFAQLFGQFGDAIEQGAIEPGLADIAQVTRVLETAYAAHDAACRITV